MICSLLGCGLILDLDPPEETRPDVGRADVGRDVGRDVNTPDTSAEDVPPMDVGSLDVGEGDGPAIMADVPDAPIDVGMLCDNNSDCPESATVCHRWICDGICVETPEPNGVDCDDGLFCTQMDNCQEGTCVGPADTLCPGERDDCSEPVCNEIDECTRGPRNEGLRCDYPNGLAFCFGGDCDLDRCVAGFESCDSDAFCNNLETDPNHCGACDSFCETECFRGMCRP